MLADEGEKMFVLVNEEICIFSLYPLYSESCTESAMFLFDLTDEASSFPTSHLLSGFGLGFGGIFAHSQLRGSVQ